MDGLKGTQEGSTECWIQREVSREDVSTRQRKCPENADLPSWDMPKSKIQPRRLKSVVSGPGSRCQEELISTPGLAAGYTAHILCESVIVSKLHLYSGRSSELLMTTGGEIHFFLLPVKQASHTLKINHSFFFKDISLHTFFFRYR